MDAQRELVVFEWIDLILSTLSGVCFGGGEGWLGLCYRGWEANDYGERDLSIQLNTS